MNPRHRWWPQLAVLLVVGLLPPAASLRAQDAALPLAEALLAAVAPADDDPDATVAALLAAARTEPRSPVAALLVAESARWIGVIQRPAPLLATVEAMLQERLHGLVQQEVLGMRWRLSRAVHGDAGIGALPLCGQPESLLACGPFGDRGDDFVGVAFPPELQFPAAGAHLPGRGVEATVRLATRRSDLRRIELASPPRAMPGVWYGRWRVTATADSDGFLELEHDGDCQVFVDGDEVLRSERWRASQPSRLYVGLRLPAGDHDVLVKTCSNGRSALALRFVDGEGVALASVRTHDDTAPLAPGGPATRTAATFLTPEAVLTRAAAAPDAAPALRVAAVLAAVRDGNHDAAIDLAEPLRASPPAEPQVALAFARVLRQLALPDELRKAQARAIEERAAERLLPAHHQARLVKASHLEEQDQREAALRLLAAHPSPGPETFARRAEVLRQVRFSAELVPLLRTWSEACPADSRPLAQLATELQNAGAHAEAGELRRRSLQLRPDQPGLAQTMCRSLAGRGPVPSELVTAAWPAFGGPTPLGRLWLELDLATAAGDDAVVRARLQEIAAHAESDANALSTLAARWQAMGDVRAATACLQRCLSLGDDRPSTRAWLLQLQGGTTELDELARFRLDGKSAIAAFQPTEREQRSSTTLLIDQHILLPRADGSWTLEVHTLRRINDQAGVDAFGEKIGLGDTDEVLLLRTVLADGQEAVPARIDGDYSFQRLVPGSFVEWRYREHQDAPLADAMRTQPFLFGSAQEPSLHSQLLVVLPTGRGELRTRGLPAPTSTTQLADGRTVHVYERRDLLPLAKENFLPPLIDLVPCAEVGEDEGLQATLRGQRVQLGRRTRLTDPLRQAVQPLVAGADTPRARAEAIWRFCQTIEDARADDALQTLLRQKGSRFLLAVALLRAAGFEVLPLACRDTRPELASTPDTLFRDDAEVQLPGALLQLPDGTALPFFVDDPRHWPLGMVPASRVGSTAWVLRADGDQPIVLAGTAGSAQEITVRGTSTVRGKEVVLTATVTIGDVGGFGLAERLRQAKGDLKKNFARQLGQQVFEGWRLDSATLGDLEPGRAPRIDVVCRRGGVQRDGERYLVPLPMPQSRLVAGFGDREERTLPWQLAVDLQADWLVTFEPGSELHLSALPPSCEVAEAPMQYSLQVQKQGSGAVVHRHLRITAATRPAQTFGGWLRALAAADRAEQATFELLPRGQ